MDEITVRGHRMPFSIPCEFPCESGVIAHSDMVRHAGKGGFRGAASDHATPVSVTDSASVFCYGS